MLQEERYDHDLHGSCASQSSVHTWQLSTQFITFNFHRQDQPSVRDMTPDQLREEVKRLKKELGSSE